MELDRVDVDHILEMLMFEFPVSQINVEIPGWISALDSGHPIKNGVISCLRRIAPDVRSMSGIKEKFIPALIDDMSALAEEMKCGGKCSASVSTLDMGTGVVSVKTELPRQLYYKIIGDLTGIEVATETELMNMMCSLAETKRNYDKFARAIESVDHFGYGIVMPDASELTLAQPEIVKQAGGYGVKLKATAPSIHLIRADIDTEISPMIGTQQQSEKLVKSLMSDYEDNPERIWDTNMFGKSLYELVSDGLSGKLTHIPDEARAKLSETLSRIINEGSGGLICIIL
jgi:stage IV sporulation protein A